MDGASLLKWLRETPKFVQFGMTALAAAGITQLVATSDGSPSTSSITAVSIVQAEVVVDTTAGPGAAEVALTTIASKTNGESNSLGLPQFSDVADAESTVCGSALVLIQAGEHRAASNLVSRWEKSKVDSSPSTSNSTLDVSTTSPPTTKTTGASAPTTLPTATSPTTTETTTPSAGPGTTAESGTTTSTSTSTTTSTVPCVRRYLDAVRAADIRASVIEEEVLGSLCHNQKSKPKKVQKTAKIEKGAAKQKEKKEERQEEKQATTCAPQPNLEALFVELSTLDVQRASVLRNEVSSTFQIAAKQNADAGNAKRAEDLWAAAARVQPDLRSADIPLVKATSVDSTATRFEQVIDRNRQGVKSLAFSFMLFVVGMVLSMRIAQAVLLHLQASRPRRQGRIRLLVDHYPRSVLAISLVLLLAGVGSFVKGWAPIGSVALIGSGWALFLCRLSARMVLRFELPKTTSASSENGD